jgi:hypothetical protein
LAICLGNFPYQLFIVGVFQIFLDQSLSESPKNLGELKRVFIKKELRILDDAFVAVRIEFLAERVI